MVLAHLEPSYGPAMFAMVMMAFLFGFLFGRRGRTVDNEYLRAAASHRDRKPVFLGCDDANPDGLYAYIVPENEYLLTRQALGRIIDELPDVAGPSNAAQSLLRFARAAWDHGRTVDLEKAQQSFHHIHTPYMQ